MDFYKSSHKEIRFIIFVFIIIAIIVVATRTNSLRQINSMNTSLEIIFDIPFQISSATLEARGEIYKIHRTMKDIVLSNSQAELEQYVDDINLHEKHVYYYLSIIHKKVKDQEGKKLEAETQKLFRDWKPIRDEVIGLVKNGKKSEAIAITKGKGANQVLKLEKATLSLDLFAREKANKYRHNAEALHRNFYNENIFIAFALLFLLSFIAYYTVARISNYIAKTGHLTDVISVIREINQLIVREKNKEKLVQGICNILITNRIYGNAWIALFNDSKEIAYIASADKSENFIKLNEKLQSGWVPTCIEKNSHLNNDHIVIESTMRSCHECPFADLYESKGAFSTQLQFNEKVYGSLTLSIKSEYLKDKEELALLDELAGDISYALYNLETEVHLREHENSLFTVKELYENIIDSVDNIIFVKNTDFNYIVCNQAFEKLVGKSHEDIIGKSDYDIFNKEAADFFREHDISMFKDNISKSNFEWVTYPDGHSVNLLTVKSPLYDSAGKIIGLVGNSVDITKEIESKEALRKSREIYQLLADNALDMIWKMNLDLEFTYVNPSVEMILGYPVYEFVGTKLNQHCSEKQFEKIQVIVREMLSLNTEEGISLEASLYKKDGSEIPLEINGKIIFDESHAPIGFQGSARDFTVQTFARKKLNHALSELEKKSRELQTVLEEAPNPIMLHNELGEVLMVNKVWEKLSGYSFDEIDTIEKWTKKACKKDSPFNGIDIKQLYFLEEKTDLGEFSINTKDGRTIAWQVSSAPLGIINGKRTIVTSAMDITELKKKDELMMAQSRHAAMGEMIGMIAHQWRQPIASIAMDANNMLLDIAFETFDNTSAAEYAQDVLDQTNHLSKTIDDFRNFFKPDKSVTAVKIEDVMEETLSIVRESLVNNSITLKTSYMSMTLVNAFPRELMQVFVNIINNAKDSLISNNIQNALIEIKVYDNGDYVCTEICDNGGGIDDAVLPKIFDPYFSTKDEKTGTGLGLYMSKMIIEEHLHGYITATNNKESGACFKVMLLKKS